MQPMLRRASVALLGATVLAGSFATTVAAVDPEPSTTDLSWIANGPLQDNHPITIQASIQTAVNGWADNATIDFDEVDGLGAECHGVVVDAGNATQCVIPDLGPGTYHYEATYSGNAVVAGSVSNVLELVIVADTVDATNVKVNYATFYPVKDGYRDSLTISGNRQEAIAVTISIYNGNNKRVRQASKSSASGGYSYAWNGRDSKGDVLPAGKYRIVQKLVDAAGTTKSFTSYSNLSGKKLVTLTKTISKKGSAIDAKAGKLSVSGGTLILKPSNNGSVGGWQFKLPSALIYKKLSFSATASAPLAAPPALIAMQNFNWCSGSAWDTSCFNQVKAIGNTSGSSKTYTTSGSASANRDGKRVRGLVATLGVTVRVSKVQVKVT